jgi:two-component system response regulator
MGKLMTILLVEDNPDHAELTLKTLGREKLLNQVYWVKDGAEAVDYLWRRNGYADPDSSPRPGLILLDIKLPKVDGIELLRQIKSDDTLRRIPTVMLTTSERDEEVVRSYDLGANSFVTKPVSFAAFVETVRQIELYWALTNQAPTA